MHQTVLEAARALIAKTCGGTVDAIDSGASMRRAWLAAYSLGASSAAGGGRIRSHDRVG